MTADLLTLGLMCLLIMIKIWNSWIKTDKQQC